MITLAWYLLKVIGCSGILFGYYYLALRNRIFHQWNRFFLLASMALSLVIPLMKINIFQNPGEDKGAVIKMLQTINNSDEIIIEYSKHSRLQLSSENILGIIYIFISLAFLSVFLLALYKIFRLRKKYPEIKMQSVSFFFTDAKGTPFSFFNSIFWNTAIDLHSKHGQQIFSHEITHIKERHSYDKIFMNLIIILIWINPFFWLIRKELCMIHEFIADKESLEYYDANAFAEMILQSIYPGQHFSTTNNFFHSPIKRRLLMFTKNKTRKVSYISRLLVLPLAVFIFFAFTIKMKPVNITGNYSGKQITVIIDAGHGGDDNGAVSPNGLLEKDINLLIAKQVAALNANNDIRILLSRDNDKNITVKEREEFANKKNADLFISIHTNSADKGHLNERGFSVLIDKDNSDNNKLLASALIEELKKSYTTENTIGVRKGGVWVLDKNVCPAVLIECGYLNYPADEEFISKTANQEKIARNILDAINKYAAQNLARNDRNVSHDSDITQLRISNLKSAPLYIVNGKIVSNEEVEKIEEKNIDKINVYKGESATKLYGEKAKDGAIEIILKPDNNLHDTIPGKLFTKVENEAKFPGGQEAWVKYIVPKIQASLDSFTIKDYGTCVVKFIVIKDGTISNVEATTMKDSQLAKVSVNAIKDGPKWIPASQNGQIVAAYRLQPVTLTSPDKSK